MHRERFRHRVLCGNIHSMYLHPRGPAHRQAGFTLIELLVVVAIIGILSSIVLVSLLSARVKGRDAHRVASLQEMAKSIELVNTGATWNFYTAGNGGTTQCGTNGAVSYTNVTGCLGIGAVNGAYQTGFANYIDAYNSSTACQGNAAGGAKSVSSCQYSISRATTGSYGYGYPTILDFQICTFLETPSISGTVGPGLISVTSTTSTSLSNGCE